LNLYDPNLFAIDPCVIADFHSIGEPDFFPHIVPGKAALSDFAHMQLAESEIPVDGVQIVTVEEEEIGLFGRIRSYNSGLGLAEVGSIFVAIKSQARLISNDVLVGKVAETLGVCVWGTLAFLEYAICAGLLLAMQAVQIVEKMAKSVFWMSRLEAETFKKGVFGRVLVQVNS
jgi:predicted nucleic acid-binding protein